MPRLLSSLPAAIRFTQIVNTAAMTQRAGKIRANRDIIWGLLSTIA